MQAAVLANSLACYSRPVLPRLMRSWRRSSLLKTSEMLERYESSAESTISSLWSPETLRLKSRRVSDLLVFAGSYLADYLNSMIYFISSIILSLSSISFSSFSFYYYRTLIVSRIWCSIQFSRSSLYFKAKYSSSICTIFSQQTYTFKFSKLYYSRRAPLVLYSSFFTYSNCVIAFSSSNCLYVAYALSRSKLDLYQACICYSMPALIYRAASASLSFYLRVAGSSSAGLARWQLKEISETCSELRRMSYYLSKGLRLAKVQAQRRWFLKFQTYSRKLPIYNYS